MKTIHVRHLDVALSLERIPLGGVALLWGVAVKRVDGMSWRIAAGVALLREPAIDALVRAAGFRPAAELAAASPYPPRPTH
jgi:hypothetical protein